MLKKISLTRLLANLENAIRRFPLASLISACVATISIILIHNPRDEFFWIKIWLLLVLAFPLAVSAVLICENKFTEKKYKYIFNALILVFITSYYFLLPPDIFEQDFGYKILIRHILWILSSILIVSFIPFLEKKKNLINAFWQYNKTIIFSLILTGIYVVAIGAGLSIALASTDFLFELDLNEIRYQEIWTILWTLFAPLFMLARIPRNTLKLQEETDYPKELKLFAKYVLLPLVSIYFLILYSYTIKVIISWEWPKGILAYMISGFSFFGVLTYIVLYPLREQHGWAKKYGYVFFPVLIPQIAMLFWALWFRISQYSLTENRALLFLFGCWLLGIAIYFLISKTKKIMIIPISLCLIIILSSFGPWSIFNISKNCQTKRLWGILENYNAVSQDKIVKISEEQTVSEEDAKEISNIVEYLRDAHGPQYLQTLFTESIQNTKTGGSEPKYLSSKDIVEDIIGTDFVSAYYSNFEHFSINSEDNISYNISDFDYLIVIKGLSQKFNNSDYKYNINEEKTEFKISKNNEVIISYNFGEFIEKIMGEGEDDKNYIRDLDKEKMIITGENEQISYELHLNTIGGRKLNKPKDEKNYEDFYLDGVLLIKEK